jgi:hypothetical protein
MTQNGILLALIVAAVTFVWSLAPKAQAPSAGTWQIASGGDANAWAINTETGQIKYCVPKAVTGPHCLAVHP